METPRLSTGVDYYKATMGQVEFNKHPEAQVTFELKNRSSQRLSEYVTPTELSERLNTLKQGWQPYEIAYLASLQDQAGSVRFSEEYLNFLSDNSLPSVSVRYDDRGDLAVTTTGEWPLVTFWETVVMSEINEIYFANKIERENLNIETILNEGEKRLSDKIALLQSRPDIKIADFGTRRRFSYRWQRHVIERLAAELPENFIGTSNVFLANEFRLRPIGTFAHEMPMVYAALEEARGDSPLDGHEQMLRDWEESFKGELTTALTDTFTTDFFFRSFTPKQARKWQGLRHDSGDPFAFGERAIAFYKSHDIDPLTKTIVFSDGLDIDMIIQLADRFKDRVNLVFGWGTTLTNDLGLKPNNFVMKATKVNGQSTVKLSDNVGKHTGTSEAIARYQASVRSLTRQPENVECKQGVYV